MLLMGLFEYEKFLNGIADPEKEKINNHFQDSFIEGRQQNDGAFCQSIRCKHNYCKQQNKFQKRFDFNGFTSVTEHKFPVQTIIQKSRNTSGGNDRIKQLSVVIIENPVIEQTESDDIDKIRKQSAA